MDLNAFNITRHLSELVGRPVTARVVDRAEFLPDAKTALYRVEPDNGAAIVQVDFHLLTTLGGSMIGYAATEIDAQTKSGKLDENLADAVNEVMNVLSAVIVSEGRAIYQKLTGNVRECGARAQQILAGGYSPLRLQVSLAGSRPGCLLVVSDSV